MKSIRKWLKWIVWEFSGLRFIWGKISPDKEEVTRGATYKRPPTFFLWIIGIYVAFFGVASQRYENRIDIIENRAGPVFTQLGTDIRKSALGRMADIQNMKVPFKPEILHPITVFRSLFLKQVNYPDMVDLIRETLEGWKDSLKRVDLSHAILVDALLMEADLEEANLEEANLFGAFLTGANLKAAFLKAANLGSANLGGANLKYAYLEEANLQEAILWEALLVNANLKGANLGGAGLRGANLINANLLGAQRLTKSQLCTAKTLYRAKLDPDIEEKVRKDCPNLLERPND